MIHKTAIVDKKAEISEKATIGPYCIVGPNVQIGEGAKIIFGLGVPGQHLFVDIEKELVIAKFSSQPLPLDKEMIQLTTRWVNALRDIF